MSRNNAFIRTGQGRDGNRFGRRECEIVKHPPVHGFLSIFRPLRVQPLCQYPARGRMPVFAEPQEIIRAHLAGQTKLLRARSEPLTGHALAFVIVIADAQVLLKVFPGVRQIVLGLGRQHEKQCPPSRPPFCVKITQNDRRKLLHWPA